MMASLVVAPALRGPGTWNLELDLIDVMPSVDVGAVRCLFVFFEMSCGHAVEMARLFHRTDKPR
jgi:hypothetical protein